LAPGRGQNQRVHTLVVPEAREHAGVARLQDGQTCDDAGEGERHRAEERDQPRGGRLPHGEWFPRAMMTTWLASGCSNEWDAAHAAIRPGAEIRAASAVSSTCFADRSW